jgi:hypothetical protein
MFNEISYFSTRVTWLWSKNRISGWHGLWPTSDCSCLLHTGLPKYHISIVWSCFAMACTQASKRFLVLAMFRTAVHWRDFHRRLQRTNAKNSLYPTARRNGARFCNTKGCFIRNTCVLSIVDDVRGPCALRAASHSTAILVCTHYYIVQCSS